MITNFTHPKITFIVQLLYAKHGIEKRKGWIDSSTHLSLRAAHREYKLGLKNGPKCFTYRVIRRQENCCQ